MNWLKHRGLAKFSLLFVLLFVLWWSVAGCAWLSSGTTERIFLDVGLTFLDRYELAPQSFEGRTIGGLSALTYDRQGNQFYALSDDRSAPHFYTLEIPITAEDSPHLEAIEPVGVTLLKTTTGEPYPGNTLDPEGLALSPQGTLWVSSEGVYATENPPQILEFNRETGEEIRSLPIPSIFTASVDPQTRRQQTGVQSNLGLESLTLTPTGSSAAQEPVRLFSLNESPLVQDVDLSVAEEGGRLRLLHYYLADGPPLLIAEHLYPLDTVSLAVVNGVSELLALDNSGHFLSLERSLTPFGWQVKLFQIAIAGASDISGRSALQGKLPGLNPIQKQLLVDFSSFDFPIRNWEGMTWGPQLADGSWSLVLISDNNFDPEESNEFLLFRVSGL
jgi:hypothetical protein